MSNSAPFSARRVAFLGKQHAELQEFTLAAPQKNEVRVQTRLSLMSTGTENIVFNRLFDAGTHWDNWVKYPFHPGYINVGVVEQIGENVTGFRPGDRVAFRVGHASHANVEEAGCYPIPDVVTFEHAVWFALAKIAYHGALAAKHKLGDQVLVIGAGPIGQMAVRWARAGGAVSIGVIDIAPRRLDMALAGGATAAIDTPIEKAREAILKSNGGQPPRVIIDSTGNAAVFGAALGLVANFGTVVLLGDTGQPAKQALTSDVMTRGLSIIGVHDTHNTSEWNNATVAALFFGLVGSGRFHLDGLNTHTFAPKQCADAYALANRDRSNTMGIIFDWS